MEAPDRRFRIDRSDVGDVCVVAVNGAVDQREGEDLAKALQYAQGAIVVDLRACAFMGSEGLRALLAARKQQAHRQRRFVLLLSSGGPIERLLDIVGGSTIFSICFDDRDAAVRLASSAGRRRGPDRRTGSRQV